MTNKSLVISIFAIIIIFAAGVLLYRSYGNKTENGNFTPEGYTQNSQNTMDDQTQNNSEATTTLESGGVAGEVSERCSRNFDAEKLKTDKVAISGRLVEVSVKGFGKIRLEFYDKDAPKTVENFLRLANSGYFDCLTFHRVAKGFVLQGGDPTGTGGGGDSAFGGEFADEINAASSLYKTGYKKGVLAMANRGPNTNTSQFFIMLDDATLPPAYTIFGKVSLGLDIVDKIGQVDITPQMGPNDGAPKVPVVMESVKIIK